MPRPDDYLDIRLSRRPNGMLRMRATVHIGNIPVALGMRDLKSDEVFTHLVLPTYRRIASAMGWRVVLTKPSEWPKIPSTV